MVQPLRIVVTGANRGLGLEFVRRYLAGGHSVLASCRAPERATELRHVIDAAGDAARLVACDVADPAAVAALADATPWPQVDLLINNAGVFGAPEPALAAIDFDVMAATFAVNTMGPLRVAQAFWPHLATGSKCVHVTSLMGSITDNTSGGRYSYRVSKAGLNMAVRSLGVEAAQAGIVTYAVHPGWVQTDMGGGSAPLTIEESVASMMATIEAADLSMNGRLVDRDGEALPW